MQPTSKQTVTQATGEGAMGICTRKAALTGCDMQSRIRILTDLVTDLVAAVIFFIVKVDTVYLYCPWGKANDFLGSNL